MILPRKTLKGIEAKSVDNPSIALDPVMSLKASALMGVMFGLLAALMAFLVVYDEYQKHQLGTWRLWKESLSVGLTAFLLFLILSIVAGYWLSHLVLVPYGATGRRGSSAISDPLLVTLQVALRELQMLDNRAFLNARGRQARLASDT